MNKRDLLIKDAFTVGIKDFGYIPLHQQVLVWAAKDSIDLFQPADNYFPLRFVKVK